MLIDGGSRLLARIHRQQLLDVPLVLTAARIQLQQDQVRGLNDQQGQVANVGCASDDVLLPARATDDYVNNLVGLVGNTHDTQKRIITVPASDIDRCLCRQWQPEIRVEDPRIVDEQILIESGPADTVYGEGGRADQRVPDLTLGKDRCDSFEERHNASGSFDRDEARPTLRAEASARRASLSLMP